MQINKTFLSTFGFVVLLVGAMALAQYSQLENQRRADIQQPPHTVPWVGVTSNDPLTLTWRLPRNLDLAGFMLRYDNDDFPKSMDDGELFTDICPSSTHTILDLSEQPLPADYYFSLFTYDKEGLSSEAAQVHIYCDLDGCIYVPPFDTLNRIQNQADAEELRKWILAQLWADGRLPETLPEEKTIISDGRYPMAAEIVSLRIRMENNIESTAFFFSPQEPNGRLMIYHQGHTGDFHLGIDVIQGLLQHGYHVLAFSMPLTGNNSVVDSAISEHNDLARFAFPLHFFVEPVVVALNEVIKGHSFNHIAMMGISGGGWTTNLTAAVDIRIDAAYAVAGGYPQFIRDQIPGNTGDFEQTNPAFWRYIDAIEMFTLAGQGKYYAQFFIYNDPCCSQNSYAQTYTSDLAAVIEKLDGTFNAVIDYETEEHKVSAFIFSNILEMENQQ